MRGHSYCDLDGIKLRLASWLPPNQRYQSRYIPADPELRFLPNRGDGLVAAQASTYWSVDDWDAGEGFDVWDPDRPGFEFATNVTKKRIGKGLVLGADQSVTVDNGGVSTFNDGRRFGFGLGGLWCLDDGSAYEWDDANEKWGAGVTTGAGTADCTSLTDGDDTFMYSGHTGLLIRRWKSASNAVWYDTSGADDFVEDPVLRSFGGRLWALDGNDLYEIDKTVANTRTLVADLVGASTDYLAATPWCYGRMSLSDVGPIWLQVLDNGQTLIWEYNISTATATLTGKLPVDNAFPYSIAFANGFIFVAFRLASAHNQEGEAFLYFQRGAQRGTLGPVRSLSGSTASKPILLAGVDGDDLLFYFDGAMWAYNYTSGGLFMIGDQSTTGTPEDAITFGPSAFVTPVTDGGNTQAVERWDRLKYTTRTATIESGLYDFSYFDIPKMVLDFRLITDPLPANTSVSLAYSIEGGSWTTVTGDHDTDGATQYRWVISTTGTTVRARRIAFRLTLSTSVDTSTPTIRGWTARAISAASERQLEFAFDVSSDDEQQAESLIADLRTLMESQSIVTLSLPFEGREETANQSIDGVVRSLVVPDVESESDRMLALVQFQQADLVEV